MVYWVDALVVVVVSFLVLSCLYLINVYSDYFCYSGLSINGSVVKECGSKEFLIAKYYNNSVSGVGSNQSNPIFLGDLNFSGSD